MNTKTVIGFLGSIFLSVATHSVYAQILEIGGQVTDVDGMPLEGVTVSSGNESVETSPGGIYNLNIDAGDAGRVQVSFAKDGYADTFGILTPPPVSSTTDSDGDGIMDDQDQCPLSEMSGTVIVGDKDTGVANAIGDDGCSVTDQILQCSDLAEEKYQALLDKTDGKHHHDKHHRTHPGKAQGYRKAVFVRCVARSLRPHRHQPSLISRRDLGKIIRAASHADLPLAHNDSGTGGGFEPEAVSLVLNKSMIAIGGSQDVSATGGDTVTVNGFSVEFPVGAFDTSSSNPVTVIITPIDVSTNEIKAFPGDFEADDKDGKRVTLETFSLMKVDLIQDDAPVALAPSATAKLTFKLPSNTPLTAGGTPPKLWYYDEDEGIWKEDQDAALTISDSGNGLVASGDVSHFTWWNVDQPIDTQTSVSGRVIDLGGMPIAGATIYASGINYNGTSYATTDASGNYCVNVKLSSQINIEATTLVGDVVLSAETGSINTSGTNQVCQSGVASPQDIGDLVIRGTSCITGTVKDAAQNPIEGDLVFTSTGDSVETDANGEYCLTVPAASSNTIWSRENSNFVEVTTNDEAACGGAGCVEADDLLPASTTLTGCVTGSLSFTDFTSPPITTAGVYLFEKNNNVSAYNFLLPVTANDGTTHPFCFEGLQIQPYEMAVLNQSNGINCIPSTPVEFIPLSGGSCSGVIGTGCTNLGNISETCGNNPAQY